VTSDASAALSLAGLSVAAFADKLAAAPRAPGGVAAAAVGGAMGAALFEKALRHPPAHAQPGGRNPEMQVLEGVRKRLLEIAEADIAIMADLAEALQRPRPEAAAEGPPGVGGGGSGEAGESEEDGEDPALGARLKAYRSCRKLLDQTIQALALVPAVLDWSAPDMVTDVLCAARLLECALESAVAGAEDHLGRMAPEFAELERPSLEKQAQQGHEWLDRAAGGLSWRRTGAPRTEASA
jgi:formiminotetrahydrofolate cyclodeaminase